MNYGLLWIDALLVSLLWLALLLACASRIQRRWIRIAIIMPAVALPLVYLGFFAFGGWMMKYESQVEPDWFAYSVSLVTAFVVAAIILMFQALRRRPGMLPTAAAWGRAPLFVALIIAGTVGAMTLLDMDLAIRARCATLGTEVNALYFATLPAITSDEQNAAPIYEKAFAKMRAAPPVDIKNPPIGEADTFDPAEPATLAYLAKHVDTLKLLHRAAALPGCRFDSDIDNPNVNEIVANINEMRAAARLLQMHSREAAATGKVADAIVDVNAVRQLAQHCGQRPLLIAAICTFGLNDVAVRALQDVLSSVKNPSDLNGLHQPDPTWIRRALQRGLRSEERYFLHSMTTDPTDIPTPGIHTFPSSESVVQRVTFRLFMLNPDGYIQMMDRVQRAALLPYFQAYRQVPTTPDARRQGMFTAMLVENLYPDVMDCGRSEANGACAQVAIAATRYRLDHGKLPTHLNDLVPDYLDTIPIDPFDGHELRLAIKGNQYVIYSIGPDMTDNGGADLDNNNDGDVTFKLTVLPTGVAPAK